MSKVPQVLQAKDPLWNSARLLAAVLDNTTAAIFLMDDRQQCIYMNAAAEKLTGYRLDEVRGRPLHDVVHHTHPDGTPFPIEDCPIDRAFPTRMQMQGEEMFVHKDGSFYPVAYTASPVRDEAAQVVGTVIEVRDIRAETEARSRLADSEARYRLMVESTSDMVFRVALREPLPVALPRDEQVDRIFRDAYFTEVNDAFARSYGLASAEEIVGRPLIEVLPRTPDNEAMEYALVDNGHRIVDAITEEFDRTGRRKLMLNSIVGRIEHGMVIDYIGTARDITERVLAEQALRDSEQRYRFIFHAHPHPMWVFDAQTLRFLEVNEAAIEHYGYSREEFLAMTIADIRPPEDVRALRQQLGDTAQADRVNAGHWRHRKRDGTLIDVEITYRTMDYGGRPARLVLAQDVTERLRAEAALLAADRRKDEFLAMLAHELRNPLAPIRTAGDLLDRQLPPEAPGRPAVAMIRRQVTQLTRLVDDLLDVARINEGRIELQHAPVDLREVVAHAVESVEPLIKERRHRLSITSALEPVCVLGDLARLVQCLANLLTNAAKYTNPGGELRVELAREGADAVLRVADNGAGIPPDLLPHVFDLFVQGRRTLDRAHGGLGIGLSVVRRLIEMQGGRVSAQSAGPGQGTRFDLRLPLAAVQPVAAPPTDAPPQRSLDVLVVDDNADAADSLAAVLELVGHRTQAVHSARAALTRAVEQLPDAVLLDIGLPEMDGYEVARRLRALPGGERLRLLAVSGYGQADDLGRSRAAGFDDHLVKPVELEALQRALAAAR